MRAIEINIRESKSGNTYKGYQSNSIINKGHTSKYIISPYKQASSTILLLVLLGKKNSDYNQKGEVKSTK